MGSGRVVLVLLLTFAVGDGVTRVEGRVVELDGTGWGICQSTSFCCLITVWWGCVCRLWGIGWIRPSGVVVRGTSM